MRHFCTLFDSKYLPQGLALYESLLKHSSEPFTLHILAMDEHCHATLAALRLPESIDVYSLSEMPDRELTNTRTWQEFCWSMASQFTEALMDWEKPELLSYLDADLFFFSDPSKIFDEIGDRSIAITPHRLIPSKKHLEVNGRYNVGWVTFRNNLSGRSCLSKWARQVRARCSAESGCGDQLYLEEFIPDHGAEVCELGIGVNVAPWNLANFELTEGPCVDGVPITAFHAHEYIHGERLTNYELRQEDRDLIYREYIYQVGRAKERIAKLNTECQWETA